MQAMFFFTICAYIIKVDDKKTIKDQRFTHYFDKFATSKNSLGWKYRHNIDTGKKDNLQKRD